MLGRGVGDFIPTVAVAAAARFGFSRLLPEAAAAENLMLKRSAIGLSVAESATTGAIGGAVFKPSDQATASDWRSLAIDRAQAGAAGALSFGALTLGTLGWNRIAGQAWVERLGADKVLKSSIVSGLASGVPGGLANAEINSLLSDGKFTTDGATIGKAMGEMAIMGGLFGATTSGLALLGQAGRSALSGNLSAARESETLLSENVPGSHKSHLQFAQTASALSITYDEASPDPKLFDTETARSILPKPSFRQRLLSQAFEQDATASAALLVNQSDIASVHATFGSESSISKLLLKVTSAPVLREIVKAGREDPLEMRRVLQAFEDAGVENLPLRQRNLLDYIHLSRRLGDDAPLRAELFRRIDTRAAIDDVGSFLDDGVDNRKFLKSILDAGVENLNLNLWALQKLGSQLNGDPKLMVRLSQLQSFEFNLKDVHEIIENDRLRNPQLLREFLADESRKPGQQSTEALKKYINDRKIAKYFSGDADFIAALKETDTAYWGHSSAITTLSYFLDKDPVKHPEIVRRLVLSHAKIRDLTQENLGNLTRIFERVGGDDDLFERIAGREAPSKLSALAEFIDEDPAAHKALLDRIVRKDSLRTSELNPDRLRALVSLDREFGADSPTMTRILEIDPLGSIGNDMSLIGIADFLGRDPSRKALVEKLVKSHADAGYFSKTHLQGMLDVSEHFAVDSPVFNKLLKLSSYTTQPDKLASFLAGEFESQQHEPLQALAQRRSLAAKVLSDDNPTRLTVDGERLQGLLDLNRMFGEDSLTMRNILVMEYGPSLKLPAMAAFASTNTGRLFISKIVSDPNLDIWAPSHTAFLSPILAALDARLKPDAAMAARLVALVGTDVDFSALSRFLEDKPARSQIVADVLRDSDGTKRLTVPNLLDIEALRSLQPYFAATPAVMPYLERLQKNGLSATRIAEFVADRPESRSKTVEELVRANADIRRFNDQMRLMVLPDNIASRLVDSSAAGGMRVAEIVGLLKDWSYGRQFMEQLITHVEGGNPTTEGDLRALANGARQLPASGSDKVIQSATSLRQPSPETSALAETLRHTAERLAEVSRPASRSFCLGAIPLPCCRC